MIEPQIDSPAPNSGHAPHTTFVVTVSQTTDDAIANGYATLQYAQNRFGPWSTCGYIGQGGPATANRVAWDADAETVTIEAQLVLSTWIRFGVWPTVDCDGEPEEDPSPAIRVMKIEPQGG